MNIWKLWPCNKLAGVLPQGEAQPLPGKKKVNEMKVIVHFFLFLCAALSLPGCQGRDPGATAGEREERAVAVVVREIVPQPITVATELAGRVSAFQISEVRPQVGGIIQKRFFEEGSDVREGDVLYQIDAATYEASLQSAKASLVRAEANVLPAKLKTDRYRDLVNVSAVSRQEYEDAAAAYKQALADVGVAKAAVDNAAIQLAHTRVTAPISGRISRSQVTPGALVTENQSAPLAVVQQLDPVYVDFTQSSVEQIHLKKSIESGRVKRLDRSSAAVRLLLENGEAHPHVGSLQFSEATVDETTGSVTVRAIFPNPGHALLPGMYVRAALPAGVADEALLVPQEALVRDALGNATVYLVNADNTMEIRPVTVGRTWKGNWIVLGGLVPGDKVIVEGLQKVRPGGRVTIVPAEAESASAMHR